MAFCSVTAENSPVVQKTILKDALKFVSNQKHFQLKIAEKIKLLIRDS